jgi:hypothetical protein
MSEIRGVGVAWPAPAFKMIEYTNRVKTVYVEGLSGTGSHAGSPTFLYHVVAANRTGSINTAVLAR